MATQKGHVKILRLLYDLGGDVNQTTNDGCSCLYLAAEKGKMEVIELLYNMGADPKQHFREWSALNLARSKHGFSSSPAKFLSERETRSDVRLSRRRSAQTELYFQSYLETIFMLPREDCKGWFDTSESFPNIEYESDTDIKLWCAGFLTEKEREAIGIEQKEFEDYLKHQKKTNGKIFGAVNIESDDRCRGSKTNGTSVC